ncbi:MAG TPA: DUF1848 domain-containing protein [Candidatus Marinimicrobia bacterium]|nr:DUF1848 domain-containing protein [Candidatus Neomarinimicrobiota bacterium]
MKHILSVSRRSDIPAFYGEWFLQKVREGSVTLSSPFSRRIQVVSLRPEDVSAIVFWSKNYQPFWPILKQIKPLYSGRFLFHLTINGFRSSAKILLEPGAPDTEKALKTAHLLCDEYSPEKILWRFDPIIFSNLTPPEERLEAFSKLAEQLRGLTQRCYVSFVDLYGKVKRRFSAIEASGKIQFDKPELPEQVAFLESLKPIATTAGIQLFTCCEDAVGAAADLPKGHCIDAELLKRIFPDEEFPTQVRPTRPQCGCYISRDIGAYRTCRHACLYCYAQ